MTLKFQIDGQTLPAAQALHGMAFSGKSYDVDALAVEETYDLVIAGAGLSGLAAAYFYRQRFGADKKILLVDPLAHFGGHASRNDLGGGTRLGYGGSESFQSPKENFSGVVHALLSDLGIELRRFETEYFDHELYFKKGLSRGTFFDQEHFGVDKLVTGDPTAWVSDDVSPGHLNAKSFAAFFGAFPIEESEKTALLELFTSSRVRLERFADPSAREAYLKKISYTEFLRDDWGLSDQAIGYFNQRPVDFFGLAPSQIPAFDAAHYGFPGFQGLGLRHEQSGALSEPYVYHFPDGNASLARLLVRALIPGIAAGTTMESIVRADFPAEQLDHAANDVRIRLGHSVVSVKNVADGVDLGVVRGSDQSLHRIRATHVTLACFNMVIPYILKDLGAAQADALKLNVKVPMVYTNLLLKNWRPWVKLGVHEIYGVNTFHSRVKLDYPVSLGGYAHTVDETQPIVAHLVHVPSVPLERDPRAALRKARKTFFSLKPEDFQAHVVRDLTRMLGPGGFQESDILEICVNRWSHGYSYSANTLVESEEESTRLMELARQKVGAVTIANSDAAWSAYAHSAIDEAHRAVGEF